MQQPAQHLVEIFNDNHDIIDINEIEKENFYEQKLSGYRLGLHSKMNSNYSTPKGNIDNHFDRNVHRKYKESNFKDNIGRRKLPQVDIQQSSFKNRNTRDFISSSKIMIPHNQRSEELSRLNPHKTSIDRDIDIEESYSICSKKNEIFVNHSSQSVSKLVLDQRSLFKKTVSSFKNTLKVFYLVRRFLTKISEKRRTRMFFTARHFEALGDKASAITPSLADLYQLKLNKLNCFSSILRKMRIYNCLKHKVSCFSKFVYQIMKSINNKMPLIQPESKGKIIWDLLIAQLLVYFFVCIPIEIFVNRGILFQDNLILTVLFIFLLIIDYYVKMNTIYYEFGKAVTDRTLIFNKYFKSNFIMDGISISIVIIALLMNYFNFKSQILNVCLLLFFSQHHYLSKVLSNLEESLNLSKLQQSLLSLTKLILTLLLFEHFFCCIWYFIAEYKYNLNQTNWMEHRGILNEPWEIKYLESFYFTTVSMTTVGYGDIVPQNPLEQIVCIIFMLGSCVQLSFSVSTVGEIINSFSQQANQVKKKIRIINNHMYSKNVSFALQFQYDLFLYFLQNSEEFQEVNQEEEQIINILSEDLKNKLILESNNSFISQSQLLNNHFSDVIKQNLLKHIKSVVVTPEQIVTSELPILNEPALCRLEQGQLLYYGQNIKINDQPIQTLTANDYFGFNEFITGQKTLQKYFTQGFLKLNLLTRSDFLKVLKESPKDYEQFCMLKDQQMLHSKKVEEKCISCKSIGHSIESCTLVHFIADTEKVIKSHQFGKTQERSTTQTVQRRGRNQFYALSDSWAIQVVINKYFLQELAILHQGKDYNIRKFYDLQNQVHKKQVDTLQMNTIQKLQQLPTRIASLTSPITVAFIRSKSIRSSGLNPQQFHNSSQSIKQKFQMIIKKVIILNNKLKSEKKQIQNLIEIDHHLNFDINIYKDLKSLDQRKYFKFLNELEYEQLSVSLMKMKLIPSLQELGLNRSLADEVFESYKEFQFYFPENNLSELIPVISQKLEMRIRIANNEQTHQTRKHYKLVLSLINYMNYPNIYSKKYFRGDDEQKTVMNQQESMIDSNMILQKFKQTKDRQKQKRKTYINNNASRSTNKIIPEYSRQD